MRTERVLLSMAMTAVLAGCSVAGASDGDDGDDGDAHKFPTRASTMSPSAPHAWTEGLTVVESEFGVDRTFARLTRAIEKNGLTIVATVDHASNAERAGLRLPPTRLVVFGNPELGTPLMRARRTAAIDLPQKMLVWRDQHDVKVAYNQPRYLADRHGIDNRDRVIRKMSTALRRLAEAATGNI